MNHDGLGMCEKNNIMYTNITTFVFLGKKGPTEMNLMFMDPCIIVQFIKVQKDATVYHIFISPYLHEAQHVLGDTPPIIRSLKLH
jgi:hypothetical protein